LDSPYLSPGVAGDEILRELPRDIFIYTCEWDELLAEAERFRTRLEALGKKVSYRKVERAAHAWDKTVGPGDTRREEIYKEVCMGLKGVFYG
jgi:acetyl esterase/lipase